MKDEMGGTSTTHDETRESVQIWFGKLEGKRQLGRPERRWEDNVEMNIREMGRLGTDFVGSW
jgi:hypothetical protein